MALDEAILEAATTGKSLPTLRLYAWQPACLSLGYSQPVSDVNRKELIANGWQLVRRPTGGRAILHTDELTYSVCGPEHEPRLAGGILESYKRLSLALLAALEMLGLKGQAKPQKTTQVSSRNEPVCFEVPSNYEITVNSKKIIGSAQARRKGGVLQHGSLPLCGDLRRITQALHYPDTKKRSQAAKKILAHATTVAEIVEREVSWEQAAQAMVQAFEAELDLELIPGDVSDWEWQRAEQLVSEKYAHPDWTNKS